MSGDARKPEEFPRIFSRLLSPPPPLHPLPPPNPSSWYQNWKVDGEAAGTVVKDGRAAAADALPRGRHGRTPRPGAAYAGWHGGDGRGGKEAGHRRHITANHDHHRPKLRRGAGEVSPDKHAKKQTTTTKIKRRYSGVRGSGDNSCFGWRLPVNESINAHWSAVTARKREGDP